MKTFLSQTYYICFFPFLVRSLQVAFKILIVQTIMKCGLHLIIKSYWEYRILWLSLAICLYHPSLLAGLLDCIKCPHRADLYKSLLVSQHWHIYVLEFTRECCSWVCPYLLNPLHSKHLLLLTCSSVWTFYEVSLFTQLLEWWGCLQFKTAQKDSFICFYRSGLSDYCLHLYCYIHNVLDDMSSDRLQVFVELWSLHRTLNNVLYLIHGGRLFWFR